MSDSRFTAATKLDANKPPMDLLPWEAVQGVSAVLDFGRVKYSENNWRKGFEWCRLAAAALRHIFAWLSGEDGDSESGLSHIDHATCCLMFLSAHIKSKLGRDNRYGSDKEQADIPAAYVPKGVPETEWWVVWDTSLGYLPADLDGPFISQDVAQAVRNNEKFPRDFCVEARLKP